MELRLDPLCNLNGGTIYLSFCPGKQQEKSVTRKTGWQRDLDADLSVIIRAGVELLVCLLTPQELIELKVSNLASKAQILGLTYWHFPIIDNSVPSDTESVKLLCSAIHSAQKAGHSIMIFCKGGLGRTGLLASCYLVSTGYPAEVAIQAVQQARSGSLQARHQLSYVRKFALNLS